MTLDWQLLTELAGFLDLEPGEDAAAAAFDLLGFQHPSEHYGMDAVRALVIELERQREAGMAVREYEEDGIALMYYEAEAADGDEDTRLDAAERYVRAVAGSISARFVEVMG